MLIGASLAGTISRDAVNNVARSLLRNIDATQDTQALQLQATKRSLLWLISGGGDVVSLCYDVCDELYPQCFRSTASNIGIFLNFYSDCFFKKKKYFGSTTKHRYLHVCCVTVHPPWPTQSYCVWVLLCNATIFGCTPRRLQQHRCRSCCRPIKARCTAKQRARRVCLLSIRRVCLLKRLYVYTKLLPWACHH